MTKLSRSLYRCLVQMHPPAFRRRFAPEMLWIFDEIADHDARIELFTDALASLARQWVVREAIQKLLIGELRFGPLPATGSGQFSWERIEFDDRRWLRQRAANEHRPAVVANEPERTEPAVSPLTRPLTV